MGVRPAQLSQQAGHGHSANEFMKDFLTIATADAAVSIKMPAIEGYRRDGK